MLSIPPDKSTPPMELGFVAAVLLVRMIVQPVQLSLAPVLVILRLVASST